MPTPTKKNRGVKIFLYISLGFFLLMVAIGSLMPKLPKTPRSSEASAKDSVVKMLDLRNPTVYRNVDMDSTIIQRACEAALSGWTKSGSVKGLAVDTVVKIGDSIYDAKDGALELRLRIANDSGGFKRLIVSSSLSDKTLAKSEAHLYGGNVLDWVNGYHAMKNAPKPIVVSHHSRANIADSSPGQCHATTRAGYRCARRASAGSQYCWQHGG
jgi:hypothetical protein